MRPRPGRSGPCRTSAVLLVTAVLVAGCGGSGSSPGSGATKTPSSSGGSDSFQPTRTDFRQIEAMLARRATAARIGDQRRFMATVDGSNAHLVAQQRTLYANLAQLPVATLRYAVDTSSLLVPGRSPAPTR